MLTSPPPLHSVVALLGGSFNPAHAGHVHISTEAIKRLGIRRVMWLVSPQNPLKSTSGMAPFTERFSGALRMARSVRAITVSDIEQRMNTRYTVDTLKKLKQRYPHTQFIWLMGADNLATIHQWQEWEAIFRLVPILVLDRAPFSHSSLRKKAAVRFQQHRYPQRGLHILATMPLPAWGFVHIRRHAESSTRIRENHTG